MDVLYGFKSSLSQPSSTTFGRGGEGGGEEEEAAAAAAAAAGDATTPRVTTMKNKIEKNCQRYSSTNFSKFFFFFNVTRFSVENFLFAEFSCVRFLLF